VLVQPSPYGTDERLILDLLREHQLSQGIMLRAILVVHVDTITPEQLHKMDAMGVRGLRVNMQASGHATTDEILKQAVLKTAAAITNAGLGRRWFIQLYISGNMWNGMSILLKSVYAILKYCT
jgi:predicted TIM-barrel fold metal-dependent hydrolase